MGFKMRNLKYIRYLEPLGIMWDAKLSTRIAGLEEKPFYPTRLRLRFTGPVRTLCSPDVEAA